jgi:type II secretory ATPase GspE/PulE/Tfp pilus assembly ATPase PilB-like protein
MLKILNKAETKILTIEDPIEYRMRGLVQMQANAEIDFTFGRALRSILRHDPDVILIGEIRDYETAEITIRTALTGHLVFSTLHTNDAPTAMGRLTDMGVEPFLIASSVEGVLAQRLVRLICPNCKDWYEPQESILRQLGPEAGGISKLARGQGCRECRFTGYLGRTCITELMVMNGSLRELVTGKRHAADIRKQALRDGMRSLRSSGIRKVAHGLTTVDEVLRVTPAEEAQSDVIVGEG